MQSLTSCGGGDIPEKNNQQLATKPDKYHIYILAKVHTSQGVGRRSVYWILHLLTLYYRVSLVKSHEMVSGLVHKVTRRLPIDRFY